MRRPLSIAVVLLALAPASAVAATTTTTPPRPVVKLEASDLLWATINVCDTPQRPNGIGLRASMPGSGEAGVDMFMRFAVQYFNPKDGIWRSLSTGGDSGFVGVGSARFRARETGRLFTLAPPTGSSFQLRGVVSFEWRKGAKVLRALKRRTTIGHPSAAGSDPAGYSAATCVIG